MQADIALPVAGATTGSERPHRGASVPPTSGATDWARSYAELRRQVRAAGLLEPSYGFYAALTTLQVLGLVAAAALLVFMPGWGDLLAIPLLALVSVHLGYLVHDSGHSQIFRQWRNNRIYGVICASGLLGVSFETWVTKHNAHHGHCNEVGEDPDIDHPLLAFTPDQAAERRGVLRWLVRYQARLYFVLAMFATLSFRYAAWNHALSDLRRGRVRVELGLMILNTIAWLVVPSIFLGTGRWLLIFLAVQLLAGVYMASVFAPNHKGMPLVRGHRPSFMEQQVLTSRNVRGAPLTDFMFGGLNYQIEHHLFPTVARNRLPELQAIVRPYCLAAGLTYEDEGVLESFRLLLQQLEAVGRGERETPVLA